MSTAADMDVRYGNLYGVAAGYLPADRSAIDAWHSELVGQLEEARAAPGGVQYTPAVKELAKLIDGNGIVRMYVTKMIKEQAQLGKFLVRDVDTLLGALDRIVHSAPKYDQDKNKRIAFPMSALFVYMMMTPAGYAAFRLTEFNTALGEILKEWCAYLDSPASRSVLTTDPDGWLCHAAVEEFKLNDFLYNPKEPHGGWKSYNDWFHREIKEDRRPVTDRENPRVIVSANDGTMYRISCCVRRRDRFWMKAQPYSLHDMLGDEALVDYFDGGDVFQSFLSGADYHRWRAPIAGTVSKRVIDGLLFSEAESAGYDEEAGVKSMGYDASVNTRGLVVIDSGDPQLGKVCVIPIGITEISSINIIVNNGEHVEKGAELGWFSYGGSSLALVFRRGAIDYFTVRSPDPDCQGDPIQANRQIAFARSA